MSNHVHLVMIPGKDDGLAQAIKQAHGRYASYWNAVHNASGHAWQGRYYSCPLDALHLRQTLRYTELNPVRAGLVAAPKNWPFSSAAIHCGLASAQPLLSMDLWQQHWTFAGWSEYLRLMKLSQSFVESEMYTHESTAGRNRVRCFFGKSMQPSLTPQKGGRPPRRAQTAENTLHVSLSKNAS